MSKEEKYEELTEKEIEAYINSVEVPDLWDRISASYDKEIEQLKTQNKEDNIISLDAAKKKKSAIWKRTILSVAAAALIVVIAIPIALNRGNDRENIEDKNMNVGIDKTAGIDNKTENAGLKLPDMDMSEMDFPKNEDIEENNSYSGDEIGETKNETNFYDITVSDGNRKYELNAEQKESMEQIFNASELTECENNEAPATPKYTIDMSYCGQDLSLSITDSEVFVVLYASDNMNEELNRYGRLDDAAKNKIIDYLDAIFNN